MLLLLLLVLLDGLGGSESPLDPKSSGRSDPAPFLDGCFSEEGTETEDD